MAVLLLLLLPSLSLGSSIGFQSLDQRIPNSCSTQAGSSCVFPFSYSGVTHYQCTYAASPTPWCATATDSTGEVVTNSWGDCLVRAARGMIHTGIFLESVTTLIKGLNLDYMAIMGSVVVENNTTLSNIRHEDFRPDSSSSSVTLRVPPLDSETGWTGELWSNRVVLILEK